MTTNCVYRFNSCVDFEVGTLHTVDNLSGYLVLETDCDTVLVNVGGCTYSVSGKDLAIHTDLVTLYLRGVSADELRHLNKLNSSDSWAACCYGDSLFAHLLHEGGA